MTADNLRAYWASKEFEGAAGNMLAPCVDAETTGCLAITHANDVLINPGCRRCAHVAATIGPITEFSMYATQKSHSK